MEYERAVKQGIPRLIFLMDDEVPVKPKDFDTGDAAGKLNALKTRLKKERVSAFFESPKDLRGLVVQALEKLRQVPWQIDAGPDLMSSLQIVLAEALNNIIEHSCSDLTNTWFRLACDFDGDAVSVVIEDNGRPMPGAALP